MNDNFKYLFLLHFIKKIKFKINNIFIIIKFYYIIYIKIKLLIKFFFLINRKNINFYKIIKINFIYKFVSKIKYITINSMSIF